MLFLLIPLTLWAQTTTFQWMSNPQNPLKGKCYEIDQQTKGERYSIKVSSKKCRPEQTHFIWIGEFNKGMCVEVDSQTNGQNFIKKSHFKKCLTKDAKYQWKDGKCYAITSEFIHPTKKEKCAPSKTIIAWKPHPTKPIRGNCYELDELTMGQQYQIKIDTDKCKPEKTKNIWFENRCYKVDAIQGPQAYSKKIKDKKCKSESSYQWIPIDKLSGNCFEISSGPDGKQIVSKANNLKCKPKKTSFLWKSIERFKGKCIEIGTNYAAKTIIENCRPEKIEIIFAEKCFQVDQETKGHKYAQKISLKECSTLKKGLYWISHKSGWGGHCYKGSKQVSTIKCRPLKITYQWFAKNAYDGDCYEIDSVNGNENYSKKEISDRCMPEQEYLIYQFIKNSNSFSGKCVLTDKRKPGLGYTKKVQPINCKELLD